MADPTVVPTETPETDPILEAVERVAARLETYAFSVGLPRSAAREFVKAVIADMPGRHDEVWQAEARRRMLKATL